MDKPTNYYVFKATSKDDERFYLYNQAIEDVTDRQLMVNTVHKAIQIDLEEDKKSKSDYKIIIGRCDYKYIQKNGLEKWKFIEPALPGEDIRKPYHFSNDNFKYREYQTWFGKKRSEGFHCATVEDDHKIYNTSSRDREGKELRNVYGDWSI